MITCDLCQGEMFDTNSIHLDLLGVKEACDDCCEIQKTLYVEIRDKHKEAIRSEYLNQMIKAFPKSRISKL
jgi:hypothetical protein